MKRHIAYLSIIILVSAITSTTHTRMSTKRWFECTFAPKKNNCTTEEVKRARGTLIKGGAVAATGAAVAGAAYGWKKHEEKEEAKVAANAKEARDLIAKNLISLREYANEMERLILPHQALIEKAQSATEPQDYRTLIGQLEQLEETLQFGPWSKSRHLKFRFNIGEGMDAVHSIKPNESQNTEIRELKQKIENSFNQISALIRKLEDLDEKWVEILRKQRR